MNAQSNVVTLISTKAALLSMDEKDYMNQAQLAFFRNMLRQMKNELVDMTTRPGGVLDESEIVSDPLDRASNEECRQAVHAKRANDLRTLSYVCHSLAKIDSGEYGYCEATGEQIGIERLLAKPTANLTVEEQTRREKQLRRFFG